MQSAPLPSNPSPGRWLAELAALAPPAGLRPFLTEAGLLTALLRRRYGDVELRLVEQRPGRLTADEQHALATSARSALVREIELWCAGSARVFAQTLIPAGTLAQEPWLANLGGAALGETLAGRPAVTRGALEFTRLEAHAALYQRALRAAAERPDTLWARRSWFALAGQRLLVQEIFLPGTGT